MKHLLILWASLALFACGGGDSPSSAEDAMDSAGEAMEEAATEAGDEMDDAAESAGDMVDETEEAAGDMTDEAADGMHGAMHDAEETGDAMEAKKAEVDAAIEDATDE